MKINSEEEKGKIRKAAISKQVNFRYFTDEYIGITLDEATSKDDLELILTIFNQGNQKAPVSLDQNWFQSPLDLKWPASLIRLTKFMEHPVFSKYKVEHEFLRYVKRLENKDLSLVHSMIPLGSCTMKLNATTEMVPISWPEFADIHPFAPLDQTEGYQVIINDLSDWLSKITGFSARWSGDRPVSIRGSWSSQRRRSRTQLLTDRSKSHKRRSDRVGSRDRTLCSAGTERLAMSWLDLSSEGVAYITSGSPAGSDSSSS